MKEKFYLKFFDCVITGEAIDRKIFNSIFSMVSGRALVKHLRQGRMLP